MDPTRRTPGGLAPLVVTGVLAGALLTGLLAALVLHADPGYAVWGTGRDGAPLRWDPCSPVRVVVDPTGGPEGAVADLRQALALLADTSGLDLDLVGTTTERPDVDRPLAEPDGAGGWRWRPVLVAWEEPGASGLPLTPLDRGVAVPVAVRDGEREALVTGQVVLNARRTDLVPGFGDRRDAWGATLTHELGHLLGLAHVDDPRQLMATDPGSGPVELGAGDRAGLRAVGAAAGCLDVPEPDRRTLRVVLEDGTT